MTNSADADQLASSDLDLHCLLRQGMSCSASEGLRTFLQYYDPARFFLPKVTRFIEDVPDTQKTVHSLTQ